jgi:phosphatidylserine decarboxylase
MKLHKEGGIFLLIATLIFLVLNFLGYLFLTLWIFFPFFFLTLILLIFLFSFFRSPIRSVDAIENVIISPADGKVVVIEKVLEKRYFNDERIQISIFMSPFNVHVNRVPVSGKVVYTEYHPGKYLVAWHPKASELNEQTSVVIETTEGYPILLRQIAGALAKRIVLYLKKGQDVEQGEEMGFIKFGSRVDIFLPLHSDVKVALNQKVTGNKTIIADIMKP